MALLLHYSTVKFTYAIYRDKGNKSSLHKISQRVLSGTQKLFSTHCNRPSQEAKLEKNVSAVTVRYWHSIYYQSP